MRHKYVVAYEFNGTVIAPEIECDDWRFAPDSNMHIFLKRANPYEPSNADEVLFGVSNDNFITATLVQEEQNAD